MIGVEIVGEIVGGIVGGIAGGIVVEIVGEIIGRGSVDQGIKVLATQSITEFSQSRYCILRIIDCASSRVIKKVLQ